MPITITSPLISPSYKTSFLPTDFESLHLDDGHIKFTKCPHKILQKKRYTIAASLSSLRSGSKFKGHQYSGNEAYPVEVDVKFVDISRSNFSGYLEIQNLTDDYPNVTTYFESEIIGPCHSFVTGKWEATAETDFEHWSKFPEFEKYADHFDDESFQLDPKDDDVIFMRWKEHFLVPDHKVKNIDGVSFSGFYYICFKVSTGEINGIYFHPTSIEKFQKLTLTCQFSNSFGAFEFN